MHAFIIVTPPELYTCKQAMSSPVWFECGHDFGATSVGKISLYLNVWYKKGGHKNNVENVNYNHEHMYLLNIDSALPFVKFLEHGSWDKPFSTIVPAQYSVALSLQ